MAHGTRHPRIWPITVEPYDRMGLGEKTVFRKKVGMGLMLSRPNSRCPQQ